MKSGFWESKNKDRPYTADDFNKILSDLVTDGVFVYTPDDEYDEDGEVVAEAEPPMPFSLHFTEYSEEIPDEGGEEGPEEEGIARAVESPISAIEIEYGRALFDGIWVDQPEWMYYDLYRSDFVVDTAYGYLVVIVIDREKRESRLEIRPVGEKPASPDWFLKEKMREWAKEAIDNLEYGCFPTAFGWVALEGERENIMYDSIYLVDDAHTPIAKSKLVTRDVDFPPLFSDAEQTGVFIILSDDKTNQYVGDYKIFYNRAFKFVFVYFYMPAIKWSLPSNSHDIEPDPEFFKTLRSIPGFPNFVALEAIPIVVPNHIHELNYAFQFRINLAEERLYWEITYGSSDFNRDNMGRLGTMFKPILLSSPYWTPMSAFKEEVF